MISYEYDKLGWTMEVVLKKKKKLHNNYINKIWNSIYPGNDIDVIILKKYMLFNIRNFNENKEDSFFFIDKINKTQLIRENVNSSIYAKKCLFIIKKASNDFQLIRLSGEHEIYKDPNDYVPVNAPYSLLCINVEIQSPLYFFIHHY